MNRYSHKTIITKCNECGKVKNIKYKDYMTVVEKNNKYICKYCSDLLKAQSKRKSIEQVRIIFERHGYLLIDEKYINCDTPLKFICPKHGESTISLSSLKRGSICRKCSYEIRAKNKEGCNNPNWNGGVTTIYEYLRSCLCDWKKNVLKNANYKCELTGSKNKLEIHHCYSFNKIVEEVMLITWSKYKRMIIDYNEYELNYIINVFKILHNNKAKPVVIEKSIHRKFHEIYGSKDNSPEQFSEFVLEREWEK